MRSLLIIKKNTLKKYFSEIENDQIFLKEITNQINFIKINIITKKAFSEIKNFEYS